MENKENFSFIYSAQQQKEVEAIRNKYLPKEIDKMEQLRKLHSSAGQKAQAWAIAIGVIGALILGTGMSFAMTELGTLLGMHRNPAMLIGIVMGLLGITLAALAYPVYNWVLKKQRARIAPEILRLTDELLQ